MRKPHSIKKTVLFFDFLIVVPLFILFSILTIAAFRNSNYEWNRSKLASVEERCSNIADRNTEIIKITNMLYLDSEINHILSEKQQLTGYEATQAQGKIQGKMRELTELFPERQYQIMILCSNGNSYFQNSLEFTGDRPTFEKIVEESWYSEMGQGNDTIYFLPQYRSPLLQNNFQEDTLFAVRNIRNLNSGRKIGTMIVAVSHNIWGDDTIETGENAENTIVMDQYRKIIYASDKILYGNAIEDNSYYKKITENEKGFFLGHVKGQNCHIRFSSIEQTGWKLISYEPYQSSWSFYVGLILGLGAAMFLVLTFIVLYNCSFIAGRMKQLNKNIVEVSEGNLKAKILENYEAEFQDIYRNFNTMLDKIQELMQQLEKEQEEKQKKPAANPIKIMNEINRLNIMYQKGRIDDEYYDKQYAILNEKLSAAQQPQEHRTIESYTAIMETLNEGWYEMYKRLDITHKKAFWKGIIKEIYVDKDSRQICGFKFML